MSGNLIGRREFLKAGIFTLAGLGLSIGSLRPVASNLFVREENLSLDFWIKNCPQLNKKQWLTAAKNLPANRLKAKTLVIEGLLSRKDIHQLKRIISRELSQEELCWVSGNMFSESELILISKLVG
jgi:hypothetical protein